MCKCPSVYTKILLPHVQMDVICEYNNYNYKIQQVGEFEKYQVDPLQPTNCHLIIIFQCSYIFLSFLAEGVKK